MTDMQLVEDGAGFRWAFRPGTDDGLGPSDHEHNLWPMFRALLPADGVFVDVGAHVGHYAVRLAKVCRQVYAVEPWPATASLLRTNVALNGVRNVEVVEVAASDRSGWVKMEDPNGLSSGGSNRIVQVGTWNEDWRGGFPVRAEALDSVLSLDRLDLVKIDVEGHEAEVLAGMTTTLASHHPVVVVEMHHVIYPEMDLERRVDEVLARAGYGHEEAGTYGDSVYWICRPTEEG